MFPQASPCVHATRGSRQGPEPAQARGDPVGEFAVPRRVGVDRVGLERSLPAGDKRAIFTAAAKASEATRYLKAFSAKEAAHAA